MTATTLRPRNWASFQHYKDRAPPWIKLHRALLDDYDFACLPIASKALAPLLWLLAAESIDGHFTGEVSRLAHRLRWSDADLFAGLKPLIDKGFFEVASGVLADCLRHACPETETETETEGRKATVRTASAPRVTKPLSRFDDFWAVYPNKKGRKDAERHWQREGCDAVADAIIGHVRLMAANDDGWKRGYVPMGSTYVNGRRWEDVPRAAPLPATQQPSKTMQAVMRLEAMTRGNLDATRSDEGITEVAFSVVGQDSGYGRLAWDGGGLDGGFDRESGVG